MTYREDFTLPGELLEQVGQQGLDILPELIRVIVNNAMLAEPYQRTSEREAHANGYKPKTMRTRVGEITFAVRAVRAAVEMLTELSLLSEMWIKEGRVVHGFNIGIGINSGEVFVGLLGSAQRINYTVIGDNANLAARLQDLTKQYIWPIIISQSTYEQVKDEFETEFADSVVVKGKTEPVNIYKVTAYIGAKNEIVPGW